MKNIELLTRQYITNEETDEIEFDSGEIPSKSFVFAFMRGLEAAFTRTDLTAPSIMTATPEPLSRWGAISHFLQINAPINEQNWGIVVGSGTAAVTTSDRILHTQILHGLAAGQLEYAACIVHPLETFANRIDIRISRTFRNSTAANIIVRECGIYASGHAGDRFHMIIRDLITPEITLLPARFLTIEYTIRAPL